MPDAIDPDAIEKAARMLASARGDHRQIPGLPEDLRPATLDEGYAIQDALVGLWDQPIGGWKVGAAVPKFQELVGAPSPVAGRMLASTILESPAEIYGAAFHMRIVESEYGWRLGKDLPPREKDYSREEVEAAVAALHPAIEVADCNYSTGLKAGAFSLVADNALAAAFVYAPEIPDWRNQPLESHVVRMTIDGETVGEGDAEDVGGHPIMPLIWLANDRSRRGDGLKAGQFVTTGSVTGVQTAPAVAEIVADFGAFGQVRLAFTD
ncbi:MAG: hydratase [Rhodospirillaceae bacterium]|jgi:2-keto-4-pentenoate hydratase|nr:hydratase [Rhodospirillaceae bacterium]MBT6117455.1 hydratase [Rhodospirillaceae bacterium]